MDKNIFYGSADYRRGMESMYRSATTDLERRSAQIERLKWQRLGLATVCLILAVLRLVF